MKRLEKAAPLAAIAVVLVAALWGRAAIADEPQVYIIGPNDVLAINVFGQPQLSGKYPVEGDGTFTFPLLGRVKVGGLSLQKVETELRERLARGYLNDPQVTVTVDQYRSQQVFVIGEVRQPGPLPLIGQMTLLEALARAGSPTANAGQEAVIVHASPSTGDGAAGAASRTDDAKLAEAGAIHVDLQSLVGGALNDNVVLRAGDTVVVPRAQTLFVSGYVKSPGEYALRRGLTVRQAVDLAGGATERGSLGRIQIIRRINGTEVKKSASLSDLVQPGDTVLVRAKVF